MKGNGWSSSACHHGQHGNSKMKPFHSSFPLISYEAFCSLCTYFASGFNPSLQDYLYSPMEGAKLKKCLLPASMLLCSYSQRTVTLLCPLVLRWDTGSDVCERLWASALSECTFVTTPHKRATHHVKQVCVQWKSIMLWCIDSYHLDSWPVTERRFGSRDSRLCWVFLWLPLKMRPDLCGPYPLGMTAHVKICSHRHPGSTRYRV